MDSHNHADNHLKASNAQRTIPSYSHRSSGGEDETIRPLLSQRQPDGRRRTSECTFDASDLDPRARPPSYGSIIAQGGSTCGPAYCSSQRDRCIRCHQNDHAAKSGNLEEKRGDQDLENGPLDPLSHGQKILRQRQRDECLHLHNDSYVHTHGSLEGRTTVWFIANNGSRICCDGHNSGEGHSHVHDHSRNASANNGAGNINDCDGGVSTYNEIRRRPQPEDSPDAIELGSMISELLKVFVVVLMLAQVGVIGFIAIQAMKGKR